MKTIFFTLVFLGLAFVGSSQTYEIADSLKALADTAAANEDWEEAAELYEQAIQAEKVSSQPRPDSLHKALHNLTISFYQLESLDKALEVGLEAYDLAESLFPAPSEELAKIAGLVGTVYEILGQFNKALPLQLEALENTEKSLGKEHLYYGLSLNHLAMLYHSMGQYDKALPLFLEALEATESSLGKEHQAYGMFRNNLASLYCKIGQYDKAFPLYLEALENTEKSLGKEASAYGTILINLADISEKMGQYDKALPLYLEALENTEKSQGKEHTDYGVNLNNLASLYRSMGQYELALPLHKEALEIIENSLGKKHSFYGMFLTDLASTYNSIGQYDTALLLCLEALENAEKSLGKEHSEYSIRLSVLASSYENTGQYDLALPLYLEALENTEKSLGKGHSYYGIIVNNLAGLNYKIGRYEKALPLYSEATENIYNQIDQSFSFMSEKEKEQFYKTVDGYFDHYLSFFTDYSRESPSSSTQSYNIELALKGLILDSGIQVRESILSSGDSAAIATYENWELQRTLISKQYSLPIADRRSDLDDLEERTQKLEADLTRRSSAFGDAVAAGSVEWSAIQNALGADEAAIEFSTFDYYDKGRHTDSVYYYAHILLPENEYPVSVFLCEESELNTLLAKTNERNRNYVQRIYGLAERGASLANPDEQVNLAELIWEPIAEHLEGKSRVYYAPSGLLHRLNLNAIEVDAFTTVADKVELVQMGSTGDLIGRKVNQELPMEEVALFGGLEYRTIQAQKEKTPASKSTAQVTETAELNTYASRSSWGDLPYTLREVETISSILEDNQIDHTLYTGDIGSEESFLKLTKENKNLDVLHFATHGYFFERDTMSLNLFMRSPNPLFRSGLILSNANQAWVEGHFEEGQEDGVLTAYEIAQLDLRNTELVVLSACETGLGDISNSEGVYGLQRAFKLAGVDYIIMTLWRVPDKQSKIMMEKFYTNWIEKDQPIPLAFRNAQAEMRELFDTYEWGGFVLVE